MQSGPEAAYDEALARSGGRGLPSPRCRDAQDDSQNWRLEHLPLEQTSSPGEIP